MNILATLRNAWKTADLKQKIIFTFFIIVLFRIGTSIPVPFLNADVISNFFNATGGATASENLLSYFNMLSGNALGQGTVFALTIQPYINASIIIQLLTIAIPYFEHMQKDGGELGQQKLKKWTRYLTIFIGAIQAYGYYTILSYQSGAVMYSYSDGLKGWLAMLSIVLTMMAGSMLVMWLGESIDGKGIGNGISIILFASIVSRGIDLVTYSIALCSGQNNNGKSLWWVVLIILLIGLGMVTFIVFMDSAERRIPIQYAKRQIGRKMYGGQNTFLPIKVAMTGVMPIIFTFAIVGVPSTIAQFIPNSGFASWVKQYFSSTSALYMILTFLLIIAFNYFYISIQYNPIDIANNIKNNGGTIPGIRPGKSTSDFITKCVNRVTLSGALFLGVIALIPFIIQAIVPQAAGLAMGGTSVMIMVSVALETVRSLESQMLMRHYKGFLD